MNRKSDLIQMNKKNSIDILIVEQNDMTKNKLNWHWSIYKRERVRWLELMGSHSDAQVHNLLKRACVIDFLNLE